MTRQDRRYLLLLRLLLLLEIPPLEIQRATDEHGSNKQQARPRSMAVEGRPYRPRTEPKTKPRTSPHRRIAAIRVVSDSNDPQRSKNPLVVLWHLRLFRLGDCISLVDGCPAARKAGGWSDKQWYKHESNRRSANVTISSCYWTSVRCDRLSPDVFSMRCNCSRCGQRLTSQ